MGIIAVIVFALLASDGLYSFEYDVDDMIVHGNTLIRNNEDSILLNVPVRYVLHGDEHHRKQIITDVSGPLIYPIPKSVHLMSYKFPKDDRDDSPLLHHVLSSPLNMTNVPVCITGAFQGTKDIHRKLSDIFNNMKMYQGIRLSESGTTDGSIVPVLYLKHIRVKMLPVQSKKHLSEHWVIVDRIGVGEFTVNVQADTFAGLRAAVMTLTQVINDASQSYLHQTTLPFMVHDWSENKWRGVMIDVARHYIPMPLLKRTVDGMMAAKLNILHLHLTDSQVSVEWMIS